MEILAAGGDIFQSDFSFVWSRNQVCFVRIDPYICAIWERRFRKVHGAILERGNRCYTHLLEILQAIEPVRNHYNWLITNCECFLRDLRLIAKGSLVSIVF